MKKRFEQEKYLKLSNVQHRNAIRDIRMSTHKLTIETGRYEKLPKTSRLCMCCDEGKVESEEHFILECKNYANERSMFFEEIFGLGGVTINCQYMY